MPTICSQRVAAGAAAGLEAGMASPAYPNKRLLILGGTTEARELGARLAARGGLDVTLSLAGRTEKPLRQPVPVRSGGFGGAEGLTTYLQENGIGLLVDATHPFAARISANAEAAAAQAGVPLIALRRPDWVRQEGDRWVEARTVAEAVAALGPPPRRIFAALGRQDLAPLETAPQHFWLVRSVDPVARPLALPRVEYLLGRGPFAAPDEILLLQRFRIEAVLSKNSGGAASYGKIAAARALGLPVHMIARPPAGPAAGSGVEEVLEMIAQRLDPNGRGATERGE
jgi:precorrin-6A/cobalt-precorrin-6A reductase